MTVELSTISRQRWVGAVIALFLAFAPTAPAQAPAGGGRTPGLPKPGGKQPAEAAEPLTAIQLPPENIADDGWFVVLDAAGQKIGYAHHTVTYTTERGQRFYKYAEEFQIVPQPGFPYKGERIEATLDENFNLRQMNFTRQTQTEDLNLLIETKGLKVLVSGGAKGEHEEPAPRNFAVYVPPMLGQWLKDRKLLEVGKNANVRVFHTEGQPGKYYREVRIEVLDQTKLTPRLERPEKAPTPEKGPPPGKEGPKEEGVFECRMTPADGGDPVEFSISESGRLMRYKWGGIEQFRAFDQFTARGTVEWVLETKGRRDPFTPVGTPVTGSELGGGPKGSGGDIPVEEARQRVAEASEKRDRMKALFETPNPTDEQKKELGDSFFAIVAIEKELIERHAPEEQRKAIEAIVQEAKKYYSLLEAVIKELSVLLEGAELAFASGISKGDVTLFKNLAGDLAKAKELAKKPEVQNDPTGPGRVKPYVDKIQILKNRGDIRTEFAQKDIAKRQTGIIYVLVDKVIPVQLGVEFLGRPVALSTTVTVSSSASMAIITGAKEAFTVMEGKEVPEFQNLLVKRIERDGIVYLYRDEEIKVTFR
ncbi:MAG: hypothetical protein HYY93_12895 [Planctomycetes bacterium]|nr:hypothetical protein [Planctomycetota bacterium]